MDLQGWRLIIDKDASGVVNMATDEALLQVAASGFSSGRSGSTLRFYSWSEPTLSIGRLQDCLPFKGLGVPVVRRITGGRAVLHHMELTYSVVSSADTELFTAGINGSYRLISDCVVHALSDIGLTAGIDNTIAALERSTGAGRKKSCFDAVSRYEIRLLGRKLVGSAQRRLKRAFLQHGSLLLDVDAVLVDRLLGAGAHDNMACLSSSGGRDVSVDELRLAIIRRMESAFNRDAQFHTGSLTDEERSLRDEISKNKYQSAPWNDNGEAHEPVKAVELKKQLTSTLAV